MAAMSIFFIVIIASKARFARQPLLWDYFRLARCPGKIPTGAGRRKLARFTSLRAVVGFEADFAAC
jgi:hypothetical protein